MLRKAASHEQPLENVIVDRKHKEDPDCMEETSDASDNSVKEPKVKFNSNTTNSRGKTCAKLRRCVVCNEFSVAHCGCCNETFCHAVGSKKHNRTYLIDCIKMKKREERCGRKPSHIVWDFLCQAMCYLRYKE